MSTGRPAGESVPAKPTVEDLGIDVAALEWQRSASGAGSIEIAFAGVKPGTAALPAATRGNGEWVLVRVTDDPAQRVLVYDRFEWECFLDGAKNGEFDDAR